jgi:Integrase core domain
VITITGIGDHFRLEWPITITGMRIQALEEALSQHGRPEIFNTNQGSQFTSDGFTGTLGAHDVTISMDGKGRCMDNIFVERLWRSLKYEEVYLHAYATVAEAKAGIGAWISFYNDERQPQSLGYRTPRRVYEEGLWVCGRSASPTGCASPASRASSESGEMLAFAHIPTGTTASKGIDSDDSESGLVAPAVAVTAIGTEIEIGRATTLKSVSGCRTIGVHVWTALLVQEEIGDAAARSGAAMCPAC